MAADRVGEEAGGAQRDRARKVAAIATGKPTTSAASDRLARAGRRWTSATQAASGPNSGPTIIAPMIRMIESVTMPTAAIIVARIMKARKLPERTALSEVRASTCSTDDGVRQRALRPPAPRPPPGADRRVDLDRGDAAALAEPELLQAGDHGARVLAGDVREDEVAVRVAGDTGEVDELSTDVSESSSASTCGPRSGGRRAGGGSPAKPTGG